VQRRFLTPDPLVSHPFLGQSLNQYSYVLDNTLRFTDPSGFRAIEGGFSCWAVPVPIVQFETEMEYARAARQGTGAPRSQATHLSHRMETDMNWELDRHDWTRCRTEAGAATDVPSRLRALEASSAPGEALTAYWQLDNRIVVQGRVHDAALAAVPCLGAMLVAARPAVRPRVLELLGQIGGGEVADPVPAGNLMQRCLEEIARGVPIYAVVLEQSLDAEEQSFCIDLLGLSARGDPGLRQRAQWYLLRAQEGSNSAGLGRLAASWLEELAAPHEVGAP